jgi:O-acetyl-ADP-ribose deacetylase (regulator of RNase III)
LILAKEKRLKSVAFPSISTGAYGYPIEAASRIALKTVKKFVEEEGWPPEVVFVLFSSRDLETYERAVKELTQPRQGTATST